MRPAPVSRPGKAAGGRVCAQQGSDAEVGPVSLLQWFSRDLAIDLGTANTLVFTEANGIVVREPSVVVINRQSSRIEAVGAEAKQMLGRTPGILTLVRPMKDGVIADFEMTEQMLKHFIRKAHRGRRFARPRIIVGVPSEITPVEKRAVREAAMSAGASEVFLVEQAMMAAIGAGLPITEPTGNMIIDIGGGTTDIAVISLAGTVYSRSLRVAGKRVGRSDHPVPQAEAQSSHRRANG